jgi:hypothetical protein
MARLEDGPVAPHVVPGPWNVACGGLSVRSVGFGRKWCYGQCGSMDRSPLLISAPAQAGHARRSALFLSGRLGLLAHLGFSGADNLSFVVPAKAGGLWEHSGLGTCYESKQKLTKQRLGCRREVLVRGGADGLTT